MSKKRFNLIKEATLQYPICENEIQLSENQIVDLLNSQSDALISYDKLVSDLKKETEQLQQLLAEYRKTNKHLSELCADASKNGYLPPLEDLIKRMNKELKEW